MRPPGEAPTDGAPVRAAGSTTASGAVILVGAGDIADDGAGAEQTAQLLDLVVTADGDAVTVFTAGDNAYSSGTLAQFTQYYDPTWGRHKARTRPSPGNHEYGTSGAAGYFAYFGAIAGPSGVGYYSYDAGGWHVISLNSEISMSPGSPQEQWLRANLAANTKPCVLAYWHEPRFSSGSHGNSTAVGPLYEALYLAQADVIVVGHDHDYERFAPQDPDGNLDPSNGIRQFVVGTGGRSLRNFGSPEPNSEVRYNDTFGVIKLTLSPGAYAWEYLPVSGPFTDSGTGTCHGAPAGPPSAETSEITASPTSIVANGSATATITVRLKDANGIEMVAGGDDVTLSTDPSFGSLSAVTDHDDGTYTATLTAGTTSGTATVTGTVNGASITDDATVTLRVPASAVTSTIMASPTSIVADGSATSTITVQLKDEGGTNLTAGGDDVTLATNLGSLSSVTDHDNGTYTASLTAGTTAGLATITGTVNGLTIVDDATVTLDPAPASEVTSTITASPTTILADGSATSTITVQLKDVNGINLTTGGDDVTLATTLGSLSSPISDNGDGTYTATLTAGTTPGTATVTGTVNGQNIVDDATVMLSSGVELTATLFKSKGLLKADLAWSGATGPTVAIYRNDLLLVMTDNDNDYRDDIDERGSGTYQYQICEVASPNRCSNVATAGDGGNAAPTASFVYSCSDLSCDFTDSSGDSDGSVISWDWDFGDGTGSSAQSPTHTYAIAGTYVVVLTVADDLAATDATSQSVPVGVSPPPVSAPTVTSCDPSNAPPGTQLTVQVSGTDFASGAVADFGERVAVRSVTFQSSTLLEVVVRVHPQATAGARNVTVTNTDGQSGTGVACFTVN